MKEKYLLKKEKIQQKKYDIKFFEASAKDGKNVYELFFHLANEIYYNRRFERIDSIDNIEKKLLKLIKYINV